MRRYENRSTIMTSNRPLEEWGKLLVRRAHRRRHHRPLPAPRHVIAITGQSYRLKDAPLAAASAEARNRAHRRENPPPPTPRHPRTRHDEFPLKAHSPAR